MGLIEQLSEIWADEAWKKGIIEGEAKGRATVIVQAIAKAILESRAEGRAEAIAEIREAIVTNLLLETTLSDEKISSVADVSIDFVKKLREELDA
jgi:hypothetical protein